MLFKGTPPDADIPPLASTGWWARGQRCAAWAPAERSAPARGPLHPEGCGTAPGGLPHQTHTLREVPRCANRYLLGAYRYKNRRPRPPTMWTDMILVICYTIQGTGLPRDRTSSATMLPPYNPRQSCVGIKVGQAAALELTPKEAVMPLMNRRFSTGCPANCNKAVSHVPPHT